MAERPVIALVGRPNVGKSTLFNRLVGARRALVASTPGVTRDRREEEANFEEFRFKLVDTGGMGFSAEAAFSEEITTQVEAGVEEADCVWLVLDAVEGLSPFDTELYRWLLRCGKLVLPIVNKADNPSMQEDISEFYALGSERIYAISATHGVGIYDALSYTAELLPALRVPVGGGEESGEGGRDETIAVAFLGRPNVGKSSLVNKILGGERMIVSEIPGTTREAVELPFRMGEQDYLLVDTAGIRRKSRTYEHLDKVSALNALKALRNSGVAILVLDANEKVADQDAKIAGHIQQRGRAMVVALNKWDTVNKGQAESGRIEADMRRKLHFIDFAPVVSCSALSGEGIDRLFKEVRAVHGQFSRRIQTSDINRVLQMAVQRQPPPTQGRKPTKIFYGTQVSSRPPTFCLFTNHLKIIRDSYTRYMENQFRYHLGLKGTPVNILWRGRKDKTG